MRDTRSSRRGSASARPGSAGLGRAAPGRARQGHARPGVLASLTLGAIVILSGLFFLVLHGASLTQVRADAIGGPFTLTDDAGHNRRSQDFQGRFQLIYFGYTTCPDVCPTTLATITQARVLLGPAAARIVPIFITIDPAHDTPAVLQRYLRAFSPSIVGLTGTPATLAAVERRYHVTVISQSAGLNHSAALYLIGPDGAFRTALSTTQTPAALAQSITAAMR